MKIKAELWIDDMRDECESCQEVEGQGFKDGKCRLCQDRGIKILYELAPRTPYAQIHHDFLCPQHLGYVHPGALKDPPKPPTNP